MKEARPKDYTLYDSIYMTLERRQNEKRKQNRGCQVLGVEGWGDCKGGMREHFGVIELFCFMAVVVVT